MEEIDLKKNLNVLESLNNILDCTDGSSIFEIKKTMTKSLVKITLHQCPYCGKTPILRHKGDYSISPYFVQCKNEDCPKKPEGWHCDTLKEAVDCWNEEMSGELNE